MLITVTGEIEDICVDLTSCLIEVFPVHSFGYICVFLTNLRTLFFALNVIFLKKHREKVGTILEESDETYFNQKISILSLFKEREKKSLYRWRKG